MEDLLPNGKPILSSRAPEKPQEARIIEKQAPKSKVNVDPSKHKTNKPGNKHNFIDNKAKEQRAKDSAEVKPEIKNPQTKESKAVEKIKNSQATELLCGNSKKTDTCAKTSGDITPIKSKNAVKDPEDNSKAPHQELTDKRKLDLPIPAPKSRPTHIQIPSR